MRSFSKNTTKKIAFLAVFLALAFGFGYLDLLIPLSIGGIPGIKLGLANLVVLSSLYWLGPGAAAVVSSCRVLLFWFVFGNFTSLIYSLCGAACSLLVMILLKKSAWLNEVGVSVCGAVSHNAGQILVARFLTGTRAIWGYFPVLVIVGTVTGTLIGFIFRSLSKRLGAILPLPSHRDS